MEFLFILLRVSIAVCAFCYGVWYGRKHTKEYPPSAKESLRCHSCNLKIPDTDVRHCHQCYVEEGNDARLRRKK